MFKKLMAIMLIAICAYGCTTEKYQNDCVSTNTVMSTSFNEENYIWENWIFPSNKTTGR